MPRTPLAPRSLALALSALLLGLASPVRAEGGGDEAYAAWDALLRRYVDAEGRVAYAEWKRRDEPALREVVGALARLDPAALTPIERKAYWINVYNAVTVQAMLEFFPLDSIKDKVGPLWSVWKDYPFGPQARSLDAIEHELLRPLGDPRIHAAIVCASKGCPPLRDEAYLPSRLSEQLDDQVRRWLADPRRGLALAGDTARVSQVFFWFKDDFASDEAGRKRWIARFLPPEQRAALLRPEVRLAELDWDWSLNAR